MKVISLLFFFVVELVMLERCSGNRNSSYIILAPNIITPGQILKVKVTILNTSGPVDVKAGIMDVNNKKLIASKNGSFQPGSTGELNIKIPSAIPCTRVCSFFAKGHSSGSLRFNRHSRIQVRQKKMSIYVQTDKGIYKPGQTVRMRVFALFSDLTSYKKKMTIFILDPNNNKMVQWVDLQNPVGIIKKDFPLSSQPIKGRWRIVVKANRETVYRNFEVKHYVLPKFEVSITLPPYVLKKDTKLTGHVTSKYTYGKSVHGTGILDVYFRSFGRKRKSIRRNFELNGTSSFTYDIDEIKDLFHKTYTWARESYLYQYRYLLTFNATVTDSLTGRTASNKNTVTFYQTDITLDFPSFNPSNFKPGLPFIVVLKVTKPNGQMHHPEYLKTLTIHTETKFKSNGNATRRTHHPPPQGTIVIAIEVPSFAKFVNIKASYRNSTRILTRAWFSATKSLSPSNSFIKLSTSTPSVKSGDNIHCQITSNFLMLTFTYLVLGRGGIRHTGSGAIQGNGDYNATFNVTSLPIMSPSARIVTYTVTKDGEVVVDSLTVSVENPFKNKVSLKFSTNTSRPGDEIRLVAKATAGSQIAFLAVDKSVLLMKKDNDISQNQVLRELQSYSTGTGWYPWWDWGWWGCHVPFYVGGVDAHSVFKNSGLIVFSDGLVYKKPIPIWRFRILDSVRADVETEEAALLSPKSSPKKVRSFFPETWIWADLNASTSGEAELTTMAPDTITSWIASAFAISPTTGFGISPLKPKLQVFQPFFISLDLPYSVVRGEEVAIKVLVFNYLNEGQKVTVTFKASKDWSIAQNITSDRNEEPKDFKEILLVHAGQGKSVAFPIVPKVLGGIILTVHAQSGMAEDAVRRTLLVEPEGIPQEYSYSFLVDLNSTSSFTKDLQLSLPETVVDGSSLIKVTLIGDMLGSSFNNLDNLLRMPYGCGEQNMVNFAPNIYILKYLQAVNKVTSDIKDKAENFMLTGYQREQTYRHRDGSYSAFGERDKEGSIWLTAFVVKSFAQARKFIFIDPNSLDLSLRWMVQKQNKDGSFPKVGYVHGSYLKGGLRGELPLTAFILIALSETKSSLETLILAKILAVRYLEKNLNNIMISRDVYGLAITAYALKLENSPASNRALLALLSLAIRKDGTLHWSVEKKSLDKSTSFRPYYRPRSADIEVTAYALLTLSLFNDINNGLPVLRWLSRQRNSLGGYASTQDTVLGIQAISEFAARVYSPKMNFSLTLSHSALKSFSRTLNVHDGNSMILQQVLIPKAEGILIVNASGYGIGMLQVGVTYHVTKAPLKTNFDFIVKNIKEQRNHIETRMCAQWKGKGKSSSMGVIEMTILSGFSADEERVNKLIKDPSLFLKRIDFLNKKIIFYFDQINKSNATCISVQLDRTHDIGKTKPVPAIVYDYYNPENRAEALYSTNQVKDLNICSVCPSCFGCYATSTNSSTKQEITIPTPCTGCENQTKTRINADASQRNNTGTNHVDTCVVSMLCALVLLLQTTVL